MKIRQAARLIVINSEDCVLFFQAGEAPMDQAHKVSSYWYLPGGGVEPGESFEEAARRELWEETGIAGAEIGPCVWVQELALHFATSGMAVVHERFFPVRAATTDLSFVNMVDHEATVLRDYRWWSLDRLRTSREVIFPEGVVDLIGPILQGTFPPEPIRIN